MREVLPRHLDALDGLRAVAVGLVFAFHAAPDFLQGGYVGVDVFFVLSGFLITTLLAAEWRRAERVDRPKFYGRRAVRLVPALLVLLVVAVPVTLTGDGGGRGLVGDEVAGVLYLSDFWTLYGGAHTTELGHLWSLAVEEQFYLIWPFALTALLARVDKHRQWRWLLTIALAMVAVKAVSFSQFGWSRTYFMPWGSADELLVGASLALLLPVAGPQVLRLLRARSAALLGLAAVLASALTLHEVQDRKAYYGGLLIVAFASAVVVGHTVLNAESQVTRVLSIPLARSAGQRSYGIYLYHLPVITLLTQVHIPRGPGVLLALAVTLMVAEASWRLVERPVSRSLKARFQISPAGSSGADQVPLTLSS